MLKTLVFHVGTVKTGSTLIQKTLWENRELLRQFDTCYLDISTPQLSLPRYTNADFLLNSAPPLSDEKISSHLAQITASRAIISDEALWARWHLTNQSYFDNYEKIVVIYIRKPVDVIAAWSAEYAKPYNHWQKDSSSGNGLIPVQKAISVCTKEYALIFRNFFQSIENFKPDKIIVRPYERSRFPQKNIVHDFFNILDIDSNDFIGRRGYIPSNTINKSPSKKYLDVAYQTLKYLESKNQQNLYCNNIVDFVYENISTGDERHIIDTIDVNCINDIVKELSFVYEEISQRYLSGKNMFDTLHPNPLRNTSPSQPLSITEVQILVDTYQTNQRESIYPS